MPYTLERIALFLNIVTGEIIDAVKNTSKIKPRIGKPKVQTLPWKKFAQHYAITSPHIVSSGDSSSSSSSSSKKKSEEPRIQNEETQVLSVNNGITIFWIANNDDNATQIQSDYLNSQGIANFQMLLAHVNEYESLLDASLGAIPDVKGRKDLLFRNMLKAQRVPNTTGSSNSVSSSSVVSSSSSSSSAPPPGLSSSSASSGMVSAVAARMTISNTTEHTIQPRVRQPVAGTTYICGGEHGVLTMMPFAFIIDNYNNKFGTGLKRHAEQKLLAAFSKLDKSSINGIQLRISGIKSPCATCGRVILKARASLGTYGCTLLENNGKADPVRVASGFNPRAHTDRIEELHDIYYINAASPEQLRVALNAEGPTNALGNINNLIVEYTMLN